MSALSRACLRLSAVAALRGTTIAGQNVFDSRIDAVNFAANSPLGPGQVVAAAGRISDAWAAPSFSAWNASWVALWAAAAVANIGNGSLILDPTAPMLAGAQLGGYLVTFTSPTQFNVTDPHNALVGSGVVGEAFVTQISFTVAAGDAAFIGGDNFAITVEPNIAGAIAVYTEQDSGEALDKMDGPPFVAEVELVLEISMQVIGPVQSNGSFQLFTPETDDELEASLDLIETQAELALFRSNAPNSALFRKAAKFSRHKQSIRFTDPKGGDKLATRYVIYKIEIDDNEIPITTSGLTGLNRLPQPFAAIAAAWPPGPEKEKATAMAAALAGTSPPPFKDVNVTLPAPANSSAPGTPANAPRVDDWESPQS
jgi:hypothetical protein